MTDNKSPPPREPTARQRQREAQAQVARELARKMEEVMRAKFMREMFNEAQLKLIDRWIAKQGDPALDRTAAVRRLVEIGLKANVKSRR
jgi:hypothetical protein